MMSKRVEIQHSKTALFTSLYRAVAYNEFKNQVVY
jgi:hypothetical protein